MSWETNCYEDSSSEIRTELNKAILTCGDAAAVVAGEKQHLTSEGLAAGSAGTASVVRGVPR